MSEHTWNCKRGMLLQPLKQHLCDWFIRFWLLQSVPKKCRGLNLTNQLSVYLSWNHELGQKWYIWWCNQCYHILRCFVSYSLDEWFMKLLQLTGRVEEKRRWSEGIHQAVEAKEGLKIQVHVNIIEHIPGLFSTTITLVMVVFL